MIHRLEAQPFRAYEAFEAEVRRLALQHAADRVTRDVQAATWEAFWRTSVLGRSIEEVARETGMLIGAIYAARSRVLARLRREIEATLNLEDGQSGPPSPL